MNSIIEINENTGNVDYVPAPRLTETEREVVMRRGRVRIGATSPGVWLCGNCRSAQVSEGEGVCKTCKEIIANRESETIWPDKSILLIVGGAIALIVAIVASLGVAAR